MQIHLSKISSIDGERMQTAVPLETEDITFQAGSYGILHKEPVKIEIENTGDRVLVLRGETGLVVSIPCDRCLEEVAYPISLSFERKLDMKLTDEDRVNDLDESSYLTGMVLDTDRLVCLEVLLNWPTKVLCSEGCKGLCPRCGKNLNTGACRCDEEPRDPRMAAISDIFNKYKEV